MSRRQDNKEYEYQMLLLQGRSGQVPCQSK